MTEKNKVLYFVTSFASKVIVYLQYVYVIWKKFEIYLFHQGVLISYLQLFLEQAEYIGLKQT